MTKQDWQDLAEARLIDAEILLRNQRWAAAIQWSEASRYDLTPEPRARELYEAISEPQDGVMKWIRDHW